MSVRWRAIQESDFFGVESPAIIIAVVRRTPSASEPFMILLFLSYVGSVLTILSPCILPVLPVAKSLTGRRDRPATSRSPLPMSHR
jgi:cytochrome c biogenesis protein CcdA